MLNMPSVSVLLLAISAPAVADVGFNRDNNLVFHAASRHLGDRELNESNPGIGYRHGIESIKAFATVGAYKNAYRVTTIYAGTDTRDIFPLQTRGFHCRVHPRGQASRHFHRSGFYVFGVGQFLIRAIPRKHLIGDKMLNMPIYPAFKPEPAAVAAIRAAINRLKLADLQRRARVARSVV